MSSSKRGGYPQVPTSRIVNTSSISPNDVLLGRGAPLVSFTGNVLFRTTVKQKLGKYIRASSQPEKDGVAREVLSTITNAGGRFLRKVDCTFQNAELGIEVGHTGWMAIREHEILRKVKQAFRDLKKSDLSCDHNDLDNCETASNSSDFAAIGIKDEAAHASSIEQLLPAHTQHHPMQSSSLDALQLRLREVKQCQEQLILASCLSEPPSFPSPLQVQAAAVDLAKRISMDHAARRLHQQSVTLSKMVEQMSTNSTMFGIQERPISYRADRVDGHLFRNQQESESMSLIAERDKLLTSRLIHTQDFPQRPQRHLLRRIQDVRNSVSLPTAVSNSSVPQLLDALLMNSRPLVPYPMEDRMIVPRFGTDDSLARLVAQRRSIEDNIIDQRLQKRRRMNNNH